jgi:release factor glutamine methyltransferase
MNERETILTELLDCRRVDLYVDPKPLTPWQQDRLREIRDRREDGEPLQYILGRCEFMGIPFQVDSRVFIPRPETELLVEWALKKAESLPNRFLRILDVGTGSGNIAVSLAKYLTDCQVVAVDISQEALDVASFNAWANGVAHKIDTSMAPNPAIYGGVKAPLSINPEQGRRVDFLKSDLFSALPPPRIPENMFDMIISNPPYIPSPQIERLPLEVQKEPRQALDGGEDGLEFYRRLIPASVNFLKPDGFLMFEIGVDQREVIEHLAQEVTQLRIEDCVKDYQGFDRIFVIAKVNS